MTARSRCRSGTIDGVSRCGRRGGGQRDPNASVLRVAGTKKISSDRDAHRPANAARRYYPQSAREIWMVFPAARVVVLAKDKPGTRDTGTHGARRTCMPRTWIARQQPEPVLIFFFFFYAGAASASCKTWSCAWAREAAGRLGWTLGLLDLLLRRSTRGACYCTFLRVAHGPDDLMDGGFVPAIVSFRAADVYASIDDDDRAWQWLSLSGWSPGPWHSCKTPCSSKTRAHASKQQVAYGRPRVC
jgi:hypothetical protein